MLAAIVIEGLSSAVGAARDEIRDLYEAAERSFSAISGDLDRRISAALAGSGSDADRAAAVAEAGYSMSDTEFKRSALKLLASFSGVAWGVGLVNASVNAAGASVLILGGSLALPEILALVIGLLAIVYCGKFAIGVIKEMLAKLTSFSPE